MRRTGRASKQRPRQEAAWPDVPHTRRREARSSLVGGEDVPRLHAMESVPHEQPQISRNAIEEMVRGHLEPACRHWMNRAIEERGVELAWVRIRVLKPFVVRSPPLVLLQAQPTLVRQAVCQGEDPGMTPAGGRIRCMEAHVHLRRLPLMSSLTTQRTARAQNRGAGRCHRHPIVKASRATVMLRRMLRPSASLREPGGSGGVRPSQLMVPASRLNKARTISWLATDMGL